MKKQILLIPVIFIAISMIVSCTPKTCSCSYVSKARGALSSFEMEKYAKNCKDQSEPENTYWDGSGIEFIEVDSLYHLVCQ